MGQFAMEIYAVKSSFGAVEEVLLGSFRNRKKKCFRNDLHLKRHG